MATSGSYDFTSTANDVVEDALMYCGILAEGEIASSYQLKKGLRQLNLMTKAWKTKGIDLWCYQQITIFPVVGQRYFSIGPTGDRAAADATITKLTANALSGDSTITVEDVGSTAVGYNVGIALDDGTLQWTNASGSPSGLVITINDTLTSNASVNNRVYIYANISQRILKFFQGRTLNSNNTEATMTGISQMEYDLLTPKDSKGLPTQWYYNPTLDNGRFYIWPTFSQVGDVIQITGQRPLEDFDVVTDNPDFPVEAHEALGWNLARKMLTSYGIVDPVTVQEVKENARETLMDFEDYTVETASLQFVPG